MNISSRAPVIISLFLFTTLLNGCGGDLNIAIGAVSDSDTSPNEVIESAGNGAVVGITLRATDPTPTDTVTYSLVDDANGLFTIDPASGVITLAGVLDYETTTSHSIRARSSSSDGSQQEAGFSISVIDDQPPSIDLHFPATEPGFSTHFNGSELDIAGRSVDPEGSEVEIQVTVGDFSTLATIDLEGYWRATNVPVQINGTDIVNIHIRATDSVGETSNITNSLRTFSLINHPISVVVDENNNRALLSDGVINELVAVDLATGGRTVISSNEVGEGPSLYGAAGMDLDIENNRVLMANMTAHELISVDITTGDRTLVSSTNVGSGSSFRFPNDVAIDKQNNRVLVTNSIPASIMAVDLLTGNRTTLSSSVTGQGPSLAPNGIALDRTNNRALVTSRGSSRVIAVDLTTGNRTALAGCFSPTGPYLDTPRGIALDSDNNRALIADSRLSILAALDLNTNNMSTVSDINTGSGRDFDGANDIAINSSNNRLLVASSMGGLIEVDPATGNRTVLSSNSIGTGADFEEPQDLTLDRTNHRLLVVDSDTTTLTAVDLATGNRTPISDNSNNSGPPFISPIDITLDEENNRALVLDWGPPFESSILFDVDLATGDRTIIFDSTTGNGPAVNSGIDIVIDSPQNRALIIAGNLGLVAVDLSTGNRTILSDHNMNTLPDFQLARGLYLDSDNNRVLVVGRYIDQTAALIAIDLATGERTVISDNNTGSGPILQSPEELVLDSNNNRALVIDNRSLGALFSIDLTTGARTIIADNSTGAGIDFFRLESLILDVNNRTVLTVDSGLNAILAIDLGSGDRVIVSQ